MAREATLLAYPRIHFGLIDLGCATPRSYGGAGAAFCARPSSTHATHARRFDLATDTDPVVRRKITAAVTRAAEAGLDTGAAVTITDALPSHVGFGAGTGTVLSVLTVIARLLDWPTSAVDLVRLSGRGRTSGVGYAAFYSGGFVVDAGQRDHPVDGRYRPSHDPQSRPPSTTTGSWPLPNAWRITLLLPTLTPTVAPEHESEFFLAHTPVASDDVLWQLAHLYHGMLPAVIEADLPAFARSLRDYQRRGFKRAEIAVQPEPVRNVITSAWELGLAAGLSSLGPTAFVIHNDTTVVERLTLGLNGLTTNGPFEFRNHGTSCEVGEG
jgi:beta-ribofuranosylaminobenzene 5'-phosphate synthase